MIVNDFFKALRLIENLWIITERPSIGIEVTLFVCGFFSENNKTEQRHMIR